MNGKQLRNSILQWAIQGELVPQDSNDEPVSVLLDKIRKEKERLVREGKLKKDKQESIIYRGEDGKYYERIGNSVKCINEQLPLKIPSTWEWTKIGNVAFITKLAGFEYTEYIARNLVQEGIPLFKGKNVQDGKIIYEFEAYIPESLSDELERSQIRKKCLLVPYVGTIGNIGLHDKIGKYHLGSNVGKIEILNSEYKTYLLEKYVYIYLRSSYGYIELTKFKKATAQESISIEAIREVYIPIPPQKEQQRIVEKLEALMPLIDKYEKAQDGLNKINAEIKDKLKASILQEAIQGKLVPQDPDDEPAIELLKRINPKFTPLQYDEQLPQGWSVCKMSMICSLEDGDKITGKEMINLDAKYLRGQSDGALLTSGKYIAANSLVILVDGENSGEVFRTPIDGYQGSTFRKLIIDSRMDEEYVLEVINSLRIKLRSNKVGAAIPHLNKKLFAEIMVLIPPLNEQQRIVEKLELLLAQLDETKII